VYIENLQDWWFFPVCCFPVLSTEDALIDVQILPLLSCVPVGILWCLCSPYDASCQRAELAPAPAILANVIVRVTFYSIFNWKGQYLFVIRPLSAPSC